MYALKANVDSFWCTAVGRNALQSLTSGNHNNAFGHDCGDSITTGAANNLFGQYCGHD